MFTLRPYQQECLNAIQNAVDCGAKRIIAVLATGAGKSLLIASLPKLLNARRTLVLAHRDELLRQAQDKLHKVGLEAEIEKADEVATSSCPVIVGSVQSLQNERLAKFNSNEFDLIIVDENQHSVCKTYLHILNHFPSATVVGFTATPYRSDNVDLTEVFTDGIVYSLGREELTKQGFLVPIFTIEYPVLSFNAQQIFKAYSERGNNKKTVVFCTDVENSKQTSDYFNSQGIRSSFVHGGMAKHDREQTLKNFTTNGTKVLFSVGLLTEGWDEPSVECVIIARKIESEGLKVQILGRGTRLFAGKRVLRVIELVVSPLARPDWSKSLHAEDTKQDHWIENTVRDVSFFIVELIVFALLVSFCYKGCIYLWHVGENGNKAKPTKVIKKVEKNVRKGNSHSHSRKRVHIRASVNHRISNAHAKPFSFRYGVSRLAKANKSTRLQEKRLRVSDTVLLRQNSRQRYQRAM